MNLAAIKSGVAVKNVGVATSRLFGRTGLVAKQYSPQILTGAGVVGVVASSILACKATLDLDNVVAVAANKKRLIQEKSETLTAEEYSSTQKKRDLTKVYVSTGKELGKMYGPSVTLGIVSISCIIGGQGIMQKRNVAVVAAYKGLENRFNHYRARVVEEFGEEKDSDFDLGIRREKVLDKKGEVVKNEDGSDKETISINPNDVSPHVRIFDQTNENWDPSPDYNLHFVKVQQTEANRVLAYRGWLSLNEVYKMLGFEPTRAGQVTGWTYQKDGINPDGDNFVDFGIKDCQSAFSRIAGTDEDADCIILDFNHDGLILTSIPE